MLRFVDKLKRSPRTTKELLEKRLTELHPDYTQLRIHAILEKIREMDARVMQESDRSK